MQGDEIWRDGRLGWVAGRFPFWRTLVQGLAPKVKKWKMVTYVRLVDRLRDQAEILYYDREAPAAGLRQV